MKSQRNLLILVAVLLLAVIVGVVWFSLFATGALKPDPVVEILPEGGTNGTLRVVTDADYWPYSFIDANGRASGREVELVNAIANHLGMDIELRALKWSECLKLAGERQADLVLTCAEYSTECETDDLTSSLPLSSDDYMVFGRKSVGSFKELKGKRLAQLDYGNVNPTLHAAGLDTEITMYPSHREAFLAIERGEEDYTVIRYTPAMGILRDLGITDIKPRCFAGHSFFCIGISRHRPGLVKKVNEAIMVLRVNGEMSRLSDKWLTTYVRPMSFSEAIAAQPVMFALFAALLVLLVLALFAVAFIHLRTSARALAVITEEKDRFAVVRDLISAAHWSFTLDEHGEITDAAFFGDVGKVLNIDLKITPHVWETILHPDDRERVLKAFNAAISDPSGRTPYDVNYRMRDRDGNYNWFRSAGKIIRRKDGTREFFGIHININRRIEMEERHQRQLEAALASAQKANQAKTAFLANMSHDIRTPMNAIIGFSDIARRHIREPEKVDEYLSKVQIAGAGLLDIINDILDFSKIESSQIEITEYPARVSRMPEYFSTVISSRTGPRKQTFTCEAKDIRDDAFWVDKPHMNRVIMNLLTNSVKYTPEGGRIRFCVTQLPDRRQGLATYRITIEDNGIGMSEEFQKHIFERFTREQNTTVSGIQGTGIGMAITKALVDAMGGTIEVESKVGVGTKFTLTFDLRKRKPGEGETEETVAGCVGPSAQAPQSSSSPASSPRSSNSQISKSDNSPKRILLVEDNAINREIATEILTEQGFEVDIAVNGREAVEKVVGEKSWSGRKDDPLRSSTSTQNSNYDLILMDIQMPVMNGLEATKAIRAWEAARNEELIMNNEELRSSQSASAVSSENIDDHHNYSLFINHYSLSHIPIIALSANAFTEDREASLAAGMDDHLAKPIKVRELLSVISRFKGGGND